MIPRRLLLAALALLAVGCAGARQNERMRAELDAYSIPRPLAEAWPDALRYVSERGYELVGEDRKVVGLPEQGTWTKLLGKGHETQKGGGEWRAETAANGRGDQYRLIGRETGPRACRIEFHAIRAGDPLRRGEIDAEPREYRDTTAELGFIESFDADAAGRIARTARADVL